MARGTTLANLRSMLKAEIGDYSGTNTSRNAELNVLLSNMQKRLSTEHYWPFLERHWDVPVAAGQQYISLPTTTAGDPEQEVSEINLDQLPTVKTHYTTQYWPVAYGITEDEYNTFDFSLGQTSDPIQRWRLATNPNEAEDPNQFEVWPVPGTAQTLRFTGERAILPLSADDDTADLDDILLVLFCAAEILQRNKQPDAALKLNAAQRQLQWLKQGYNVKDKVRTMDGKGDYEFNKNRRLIGVAVLGAGSGGTPSIGIG